MRRQSTFLQMVRSEALAAERALGITRAADALRIAERIHPESLPEDPHHAARQLVRMVFDTRREVPAA